MPETPAPAPAREDGATARVRALLRGSAAAGALARGRLTPIAGGLSNRAWRVDVDGEAWFVRLGNPAAARLGVDRRSECAVLRAVAGAGLAPGVLTCQAQDGLLVTRFIAGAPWLAADVAIERNLRRLGKQLRRLHELPVPAGVATVAFARQVRALEAAADRPDARLARLHAAAGPRLARIAGRMPRTALCHHDLHHLNVVDDGDRLWLVDWEYAGRGDPLLDLAGFLAMHELDPAATAVLLGAYGGLHEDDLACLDDARWAFDYVQWLWYRVRFPDPPAETAGRSERLAQRLLRCNN